MIFKILALSVLLSGHFICLADDVSKLKSYSCNIRYEIAEALKSEKGCEMISSLHPMCGRDITASFSESHPYIFSDNIKGKERVRGILPGIDRFIISNVRLKRR